MYAWLWHRLPFGFRGKLAGALVLLTGVVALLWYVVFPAVEPVLPINDGQITDTGGDPAGGEPGVPAVPNQPSPTTSR